MDIVNGLIWNAIGGSGGGGTTVEQLNVTGNGTYTAETGKAYSPVVVNVEGGGIAPKQVNFYDYDGTLLYAYTGAEFSNLDSLPENPSHSGLVAQGWNWTKAQITEQLAECVGGDVNVGQMYTTESGNTEVDITLTDSKYLNPCLELVITGTVNVIWGDGTSEDVTGAGARSYTPHTYPSTGSYTVQIKKVSGTYQIGVTSSPYIQIIGINTNANATVNGSTPYSAAVKNIRVSPDAKVVSYAFRYMLGLETITFPNVAIYSGNGLFDSCVSLKYIVIPSGTTTAFSAKSCYKLKGISIPVGSSIPSISSCKDIRSMTIPKGAVALGQDVFRDSGITKIIAPSSVKNVGSYVANACYDLTDVYIPSATSFDGSSFGNGVKLKSAVIGGTYTSLNYNFYYCPLLKEFTVPASVTSIASNTFGGCYSLHVIHMLPTTPPTLATDYIFGACPSDLVIYVPSASVNDYKTAQYWSTHADKIVGE